MLYSCTHMATVGVKGLSHFLMLRENGPEEREREKERERERERENVVVEQ